MPDSSASRTGGGDAAAVQTADDMEDVVERSAERFGGPAAGQFARDRVDHGDAFPGVGHDHSVADGLERQGEAGGRVGGFLTADCRSPESWETPMTAFFPNIFGEASEKMMVRFSPPEL